jgi:hypothetical protein
VSEFVLLNKDFSNSIRHSQRRLTVQVAVLHEPEHAAGCDRSDARWQIEHHSALIGHRCDLLSPASHARRKPANRVICHPLNDQPAKRRRLRS